MFSRGPCRASVGHDVAVPFFIAPQGTDDFARGQEMKSNLTWPVVAIICSVILASGVYFGLRDSQLRSAPQPSWRSEAVAIDEHGNKSKVPSYEELVGTNPKQQKDAEDPIVYITRTGECYHRGNCGYLRRSKIPMKLSQAKNRYRPCSRCGPPR